MTTGALLDDDAAIDAVDQIEAGVKVRNIPWVPGTLDVFATFFYTEAEENNVDITIVPLTFFNREYEAHGLEFLANYASAICASMATSLTPMRRSPRT